MLLAEGDDGVVEYLRKLVGAAAAHGTDAGAALLLEGDRLRRSGEHGAPVFLVRNTGRGGEIFPLFFNMCGIAGRGLRLGVRGAQKRKIGFRDAVAQQHLGPAVENNVVGLHEDPALFLAGAEQEEAAEGRVVKLHRLPRYGGLPVGEALGIGERKIEYGEKFLGVRGIFLHDPSALRHKSCAQGRVGGHNEIERLGQQGKIHPAAYPHGGAYNVYRGAGVTLFEIPYVLLAHGQRYSPAASRHLPHSP